MVMAIFSSIVCCTSRQIKNFSDILLQAQFSDGIPVIDVESAIAQAKNVYKLSDIAERIEYIPLEFKPECAIGGVAQVYFAQDDIFILAMGGTNNFLRFDKNGKFLNVIGSRGRGPGEYIDALFFTVDTAKRQVYLNANWIPSIIVYDYEGRYLRTIIKDYSFTYEIFYLPESNELAHINSPFSQADRTQPTPFFLSVTDIDNNRVFQNKFLLPSLLSSDQKVVGGYSSLLGGNQLFLSEEMNDTIFVYSHGLFNPYLILNYGKYKLTLNAKILAYNRVAGATDRYIIMTHIVLETPQFLFLLFVQENGKRYLLRFDKHNQEYATFIVEEKREIITLIELFYNDIDGGFPIIWRSMPRYNKLVRIVDAYDMKEILTSEYFSNSEAKDPQAKERLKNLVDSLDDEDNPVIMKVILK